MGKIWEFFDTLDEVVYVSDINSYELIYMNKKALQKYGLHSLEEIKGKKCYEILQHSSTPCSMCNNQTLKQGCFTEWQYYNPLFDNQALIKDTLIEEDGKAYRMELAFETTTLKQHDNIMNLETKINEGLRVALQQKTPSQTLEVLLEYLGKALGGERTYIFERNENGHDDNTYEWVASGVTPEKDSLQNLPPEICASWYQKFKISKYIAIRKLEDIQESDPIQYETLKRQNVHSLLVVPLYNENEIIGFYGVDNPPVEALDYASDMLQITSHFIISSLKRRNLIRKLKKISYLDQLTQIGNRHAMNEYISNLQKEQNLGIVYCDVTGLKKTNDEKGHTAGDKLLLDACECLKKNFGEYGLFRIGGDELLAICMQINEQSLWQGIEQLKKDLIDKSVHMAVGGLWEENSSKGIDKLIAEAEERMYEDKAAYYEKHGSSKRYSTRL